MNIRPVPAAGLAAALTLREAVATEFRDVVELVRAALAQKLGKASPWDVELEAMYPDRVVVCGDAGRDYAYPYTIDANNQVQLGEPTEVVEQHVSVKEAVGVFIESAGSAGGGSWLIRVIKAGASINGNYYPDALLRECVSKFDGVRVFNKSEAEHIKGGVAGKSVDNLIGALRNPRFVEGKAPDTGEIQAELVLIEPNGTVAVKLREAFDRKLADLFGFSIDADGTAKVEMREGRKVRVAKSITRVNSVDLIVEPSAGGELIRLIEAVDDGQSKEKADMALREIMLAAIKAHNPNFDGATATEEEIATSYREAVTAQRTPPVDTAAATLREVRLVEARISATAIIGNCKLPQAAKDKLQARFAEAKEPFTADDVNAAITAEREYLAKFTESGKPVIPFDDIQVEDRSKKMSEMFDAFFDPNHKDHKAVGSFKECYIEFTGDRRVTGRLRDCDMARLRESAGASGFREAVDSTTFANALGDSITRRMQAVFVGLTDLQAWKKVASTGSASDFRTQERIRIGGYGNLPGVAQGGPYNPLTSPSDGKATYAVSKRGGTESVTLEAIKNDDVNALRRIPVELALAAGNTLYEFVFDFFLSNPVIYDGNALFHASHNNLFTGALSSAEFAAHRLAMTKQTRAGSGKRLGLTPRTALVPYDLQEAAYNLFVRGQNLDKTFIQTINPEVICVPYWTDANDWCTVCDPMAMPVLEVSFLDGQEQPELFVQDMPNMGSMFSNDKLTYKIRHIYGGAVLVDGEKGVTKAVVA